jgi:hypothetical protein
VRAELEIRPRPAPPVPGRLPVLRARAADSPLVGPFRQVQVARRGQQAKTYTQRRRDPRTCREKTHSRGLASIQPHYLVPAKA